MKRLAWLSVVALLAGIGLGIVYAWVFAPIQYVDTTPDALRADFKDNFRSVISAAYAATHNLERARARLALLGDADPIDALTAQAQRMLAAGESPQTVENVARLASDLRGGNARPLPSATVSAPSATATPRASSTPSPVPTARATTPSPEPTLTEAATQVAALDTPTPRPTRTSIPTASAPFQLLSQDPVCNPNLTEGLMQVSILDSHRHQMPGVEIDISWAGVEETFYTGLKPEIADGYADFIMQPGVSYSVRVEHAGTPVTGLTAPSCPDSNAQTYVGGLKLVFKQP